MKRAGIRRGDEVCSTTKMMKRTIKKVVPSWIFFACGGPNNKGDPGSPSKAFARTKTAGRKSDGTTPASPREMMTCASRFPKLVNARSVSHFLEV